MAKKKAFLTTLHLLDTLNAESCKYKVKNVDKRDRSYILTRLRFQISYFIILSGSHLYYLSRMYKP